MRPQVTAESQAHVLRAHLDEAGIKHGDHARVDVRRVRVGPPRKEDPSARPTLYFCPMEGVRVKEILAKGDGGELPMEAGAEGLEFPNKLGVYDLKDAFVLPNGRNMVIGIRGKTRYNYVGAY